MVHLLHTGCAITASECAHGGVHQCADNRLKPQLQISRCCSRDTRLHDLCDVLGYSKHCRQQGGLD